MKLLERIENARMKGGIVEKPEKAGFKNPLVKILANQIDSLKQLPPDTVYISNSEEDDVIQ